MGDEVFSSIFDLSAIDYKSERERQNASLWFDQLITVSLNECLALSGIPGVNACSFFLHLNTSAQKIIKKKSDMFSIKPLGCSKSTVLFKSICSTKRFSDSSQSPRAPCRTIPALFTFGQHLSIWAGWAATHTILRRGGAARSVVQHNKLLDTVPFAFCTKSEQTDSNVVRVRKGFCERINKPRLNLKLELGYWSPRLSSIFRAVRGLCLRRWIELSTSITASPLHPSLPIPNWTAHIQATSHWFGLA